MSSVNHEPPPHVIDLLGRALSVAKRAFEAEVAGEPHHLRGSHLRLLSLTPVEGMRPTLLARRVGMTKQSLGEFVATMQGAGLLQVDPDPHDGRARIVRPTDKGRALQLRILEIIAETEQTWREAVGPRNWASFRKVLARIAAEGQPRATVAS